MKPPAWMRRAALRAMGFGDVHSFAGVGELLAIRHGATLTGYDDGEPHISADGKPYRLVDGIAEFRVCGPLSKDKSFLRMIGLSCKPTLTEMAATVRAAALDDSVRGGMQYLDSPGGTFRGASEYMAALAEFRARKPLHSFAETADSLAYMFAASSSRITVSLWGEVGSIGALYRILDASKAGEIAGLKMHLIRTGPVKAAGSEPLAGLSDEESAALLKRANDANDFMMQAIADGRGVSLEAIRELATGATYSSADAVANGLADAVGTYGEAMAALVAAIAAVPPTVGAAPEPESDEEIADEPAPPITEAPEETAMAEKNAGAPAGTGAEEQEKKSKLAAALASIGQMFGIGEAAPAATAAAVPVANPPAGGLTAEQVRQEIAAARAEDAVDADLRALASTIPPAVLGNARTRASLIAAKLEGPDAYAHQLGLVKAAGEGAGSLLGGPVADATNAGDGIAKTHRTDMLARAGITIEREAELIRRYGIDKSLQQPVN